MKIIAPTLLETLVLVSLAIVIACFVAAVGGFVRYATRAPGSLVGVYWLMKLGIFVGVPFSIVGMISGYMMGSSRESAISAIVPAGLTLIGGMAVYLFTKGGKTSVLAAFAVINFSVLMLVGVLIGARERVQTEQIQNSYEYRENEIHKEYLLQLYRRGLGLEEQPKAKKPE
jgi:hypothetical protein